MRQKIIGTYYAGNESVQVVLRDDFGGEFYLTPEIGSVPRIKVGADEQDWHMVSATLLHEILELLFDRLKCRFTPTNEFSNNHSAYLFVVDHTNFSDICYRAAEFLDCALPPLKKEWKRWNKKEKDKNLDFLS